MSYGQQVAQWAHPRSWKSLTLRTGAVVQKWLIWKVRCWCFHTGKVQSRWTESNALALSVYDNNQFNSEMKHRACSVARRLQHTLLKIIWILKVVVVWCAKMRRVGLLSSGLNLWFCTNVRKQRVIFYAFWCLFLCTKYAFLYLFKKPPRSSFVA